MLSHLFIDAGNVRAGLGLRVIRVVVAAGGLGFFLSLMTYEAVQSHRASRWPTVPCIIQRSEVKVLTDARHESSPYVLNVYYAYKVADVEYVSEKVDRKYHGDAAAADAYALQRSYPVGAERTCYVNPANPREAYLRPDQPLGWLAMAAGTGVVFVLVLVFYCIPQLISPPSQHQWLDKQRRQRRHNGIAGACLAVGFGAVTVWLLVMPIVRVVETARWCPTPCTIISAEVRAKDIHGEHHLRVYRPDIVYTYWRQSSEHRSNQYSLTDFTTPWYYGKRSIVRQYPSGAAAVCYVNPKDPTDAVLVRRPSITLLFGLWPAALTVLGICGFARWCLGRIPQEKPAASAQEGAVVFRMPRGMTTNNRVVVLLVTATAAVTLAVVFFAMLGDVLPDVRSATSDRCEVFWLIAAAAAWVGMGVAALKALRACRRGDTMGDGATK